jgi:hypothetical protein
MSVRVHIPDVRNVVLLQVTLHALTDADQVVFVAAGEPQQFELLPGLRRMGNQFLRPLGIGRGGETANPRKCVEVGQAKIE